MNLLVNLPNLVGAYSGDNQLWLMPGDPVRASKATAVVSSAAQGQFLQIAYTWDEGGPQDGVLWLGESVGAWIDSWHMTRQVLSLRGEIDEAGALWGYGSYPAPEGPDWGWNISVAATGGGLLVAMFNVPPGMDPIPAVEIRLERTL